jgi:hypothetical protein
VGSVISTTVTAGSAMSTGDAMDVAFCGIPIDGAGLRRKTSLRRRIDQVTATLTRIQQNESINASRCSPWHGAPPEGFDIASRNRVVHRTQPG